MLYEFCFLVVVYVIRIKRGEFVYVIENDMYMNFLVWFFCDYCELFVSLSKVVGDNIVLLCVE